MSDAPLGLLVFIPICIIVVFALLFRKRTSKPLRGAKAKSEKLGEINSYLKSHGLYPIDPKSVKPLISNKIIPQQQNQGSIREITPVSHPPDWGHLKTDEEPWGFDNKPISRSNDLFMVAKALLSAGFGFVKILIGIILLGCLMWLGFTTYSVYDYNSHRYDIAKGSFDLINAARVSNGLHRIEWDNNLQLQAEQHSIYMATIDDLELSRLSYGEIVLVGANGSSSEMFQALRNSPDSRGNFLNPGYHSGAIAIGAKLDNISIGDWVITYNISRWYSTFFATS